MKATYPIIISKGKEYLVVYIPDFDINTQGIDEADAMKMARDAIGIVGIDIEDENDELPTPSKITNINKTLHFKDRIGPVLWLSLSVE